MAPNARRLTAGTCTGCCHVDRSRASWTRPQRAVEPRALRTAGTSGFDRTHRPTRGLGWVDSRRSASGTQTGRSGHAETVIDKLDLLHPAIDAQFGSRDEARLVAQEEQCGRSHFLRTRHAAERDR